MNKPNLISLGLLLAIQAWAGNLTIDGNLAVNSNLTAQSITLGDEKRTAWPSDSSSSGATNLTSAVLDFTKPGPLFRYTLTNDVTWTFTNHLAGHQVWLQISQNTAGGWNNVWPADLFWPAGRRVNVSQSPNSCSVFEILDNGTNWLAFMQGINFATNAAGAYALQFDGANNSARANVTALQSPLTVEFWMRSTGGQDTLLSQDANQNSGWAFWQLGSAIRFAVWPSYSSVYLEGGDVSDGQWHHVAGTYDGTSIQLWIDTNSIGIASASYTPSSAAVAISGHSNSGPEWGGIIDEVRFSSIVRYTSSVNLATSFTVDSDTVAYWKLNEGEGSTAYDETGNYNFTLQGVPLPTWAEGR